MASTPSCCQKSEKKKDLLLWGSLFGCVILYSFSLLSLSTISSMPFISEMAESVFALMNTIWWGLLLGILMLSLLTRVPREFVVAALGPRDTLRGIFRATIAGVLLDLCSHGILMVAAKLYERGASTAQVMAFLISSPWNSFTLLLILLALIGWQWTLVFLLASMLIAFLSGCVFMWLQNSQRIAPNPNEIDIPADFDFWGEARKGISELVLTPAYIIETFKKGISESRMVVRWILFGVLLASVLRAGLDPDLFASYFGPSLMGLAFTVLAATVIEVCSEGSTPIAADLFTRGQAPGNSFAFLMAGVATDYTEVMVLRDTTKSWRIALLLPLVTLPQVIVVAYFLNTGFS
ncbi:MAG: permease [Gammaproteobacteria bacterium]|nr:permease [Gammaproteobacteria bacterium]